MSTTIMQTNAMNPAKGLLDLYVAKAGLVMTTAATGALLTAEFTVGGLTWLIVGVALPSLGFHHVGPIAVTSLSRGILIATASSMAITLMLGTAAIYMAYRYRNSCIESSNRLKA